MMGRITEFFKDDVGAFSCMRLMACIVILAALVPWIVCVIKTGQYVPLGYAEAGLVAAALGGKAAQGYFEYGGGA